MTPDVETPRKLRFVPEITLGTMVHMGAMLIAITTAWAAITARMGSIELRQSIASAEYAELKVTLKSMTAVQAETTRSLDRLTLLVELMQQQQQQQQKDKK